MRYRVKEIRKQKGITQEELARTSGTSRQTISSIENNDGYNATTGTLIRLARALNTTVDKLFFEKAV